MTHTRKDALSTWSKLSSAASWVSALDGGLLTTAAWRRRHRAVCALVSLNAALAVVFAVAAGARGVGFWTQTVALAVALSVAWWPSPRRRPHELAIVVACLLCAAVQNHYVANLSSLSAAYVILVAVYQDWLPLAAALVGILVLPVLAIVDPGALEQWRAFEREAPGTGAFVRTLGVYVAAGVAVLVWRANGVAARDALTGLATREHAERRLTQALRSGRRSAVLVCDVDAFRLVADDLPRTSANALIRDVGRRLRITSIDAVRIVAAGGGAKYLVVHPGDTDIARAQALAQLLCEVVADEPFRIDAAEVPLTITVGLAVGEPDDEASDLVRAADLAMLRAKGRGAAAIAVADQPIVGTRPRPNGPITAELRRALKEDELVMHYQPLIDLRSGAIVGTEALVRWEHPTRGLLGPGAFLPYGETHPWLNAAISQRIARMVLRQTASWDSRLPGSLSAGVAINLAPTRLKDPALCESIAAQIEEEAVDPRRLVFELTEGALMDTEIDAPTILADLAGLGVRVALDDFGTGHSSLAHLRDFPLHEIKIDRSFVARILDSSADRAVIRAVLAIAAEFSATVVVEGVEEQGQCDTLLAMDDGLVAQGFFFARPMPAADFTRLLEATSILPIAESQAVGLSRDSDS